MNESATPDRADLRFAEASKTACQFLEDDYGFEFVGGDTRSSHYRNEILWLIVMHDQLSFELDIGLARTGEEDELAQPFSMADLLRVENPEAARAYRCFASTTPGAVQRGLDHLAMDLRRYGDRALHGDAGFFERLALGRVAAVEELGSELAWGGERRVAERAFGESDWARVVEIYGAHEGTLGAAERKRLELARRRVLGPDG